MKKGILLLSKFLDFKMRYIISFVVPIVIVCVFMFQLYDNSVKTIENEMDNSNLRVIESIGNAVDNEFSNMILFSDLWYTNKRYHQILNPMYADYIQQFSDYLEIGDNIKALLSYYSDNILRIFIMQHTLLSSEFSIFYPVEEISNLPYYQTIINNPGGLYWDGSREGAISMELTKDVISVFRPIYDLNSIDKKLIAIVEVAIPKYVLVYRMTDHGVNNAVYLVSEDGKLMAGDSPTVSIDHYIENIRGESGSISIDDDKKLYYSKLKSNEWYIISIVDNSKNLTQIKRITIKYILIAIVVLLILIFLSFIMTKTLRDRVNSIIGVLTKTEKEKFTKKIKIQFKDELTDVEVHINQFIERIQNLMLELKQSHMAEKEAEMSALQAQINPHFLYNTLDSINWMAIDNNNMNISEVTTKLGDFLRLSLNGGEKLITIAQEIDHCKLYIDIQKIRTRNSLDFEFDIDEKILEYKIIKLILQPIIENAIIHGFLKDNLKEGKIKVKGYLENDQIIISIEDNGVGFDMARHNLLEKSKNGKSHYGVYNIKERLFLQYGNRAHFIISSQKGQGTVVEFRIPIKH